MNTVIIRIENDKLPALKKFVKEAAAKLRIVKDEDDIMVKLIEEGLQSEIIPEELVRKNFKKHGVDL